MISRIPRCYLIWQHEHCLLQVHITVNSVNGQLISWKGAEEAAYTDKDFKAGIGSLPQGEKDSTSSKKCMHACTLLRQQGIKSGACPMAHKQSVGYNNLPENCFYGALARPI